MNPDGLVDPLYGVYPKADVTIDPVIPVRYVPNEAVVAYPVRADDIAEETPDEVTYPAGFVELYGVNVKAVVTIDPVIPVRKVELSRVQVLVAVFLRYPIVPVSPPILVRSASSG